MIQNLPIGNLRQWLNEDRIKDPERFVTNEEIMFMLDIITKEELEASIPCACGLPNPHTGRCRPRPAFTCNQKEL